MQTSYPSNLVRYHLIFPVIFRPGAHLPEQDLRRSSNCCYAGDLDDADFRKSGDNAEHFKNSFMPDAVQQMVTWSATAKGITQSIPALKQ